MTDNRGDKELEQAIDEQRRAAENTQGTQEREFGMCMSYYEGHANTRIVGPLHNRLQQLRMEYDQYANNFRVGYNVISKYTQRAIVATKPVNISVDVSPPDRATGNDALFRAKISEDVLNEYIDLSNMIAAWGYANEGRSINGSHGFGWCMRPTKVAIEGEIVPDVQIEAFDFLPIKLSLDPYVQDRDLSRHERVLYSDAWSWKKILNWYGDAIKQHPLTRNLNPENDLSTLGDLCTFEITINAATNNLLYSGYRAESRTRGAIIHQFHQKVEYGRFVTDVMLELPGKKYVRLTPESRRDFGGNGLPLFLIHGHPRSDSMWGIGDVKMMLDDQDRINRSQTNLERMLNNNVNYKWRIDLRTLPAGDKGADKLARKFNNRIGGFVTYESGLTGQTGNPPDIVTPPQPQSFLPELISRYEGAARENIHRAQGHLGETKTHVPDASFQRAMDEASQVLDMRIADDKKIMRAACLTMFGTVLRLVQRSSPATLGLLVERGFDEQELATLAGMNPENPEAVILIRDSSIRLRSQVARKQDLDAAIQFAAITPAEYKREMAAMDTPITSEDRTYQNAFQRYARDVAAGMEWAPLSLGARSDDLIESFRQAMLSRETMADPAAMDRLNRAIQAQQQFAAQELGMLQALMAGPQAQAAPAQPPDPSEAAVEDLLGQIAGRSAA